MTNKKFWEELIPLIRHGPQRKEEIKGDTQIHRQQGHLACLFILSK
jgi:hypothetical protein